MPVTYVHTKLPLVNMSRKKRKKRCKELTGQRHPDVSPAHKDSTRDRGPSYQLITRPGLGQTLRPQAASRARKKKSQENSRQPEQYCISIFCSSHSLGACENRHMRGAMWGGMWRHSGLGASRSLFWGKMYPWLWSSGMTTDVFEPQSWRLH